MKRKWEGKIFGVCLIRWGGKKINGEIQVFFLMAHQKVFYPKLREIKIFSIIILIHPPNETNPLIVFILYFNSITIMETRKFKIGTVTTRLTLKGF